MFGCLLRLSSRAADWLAARLSVLFVRLPADS